MTDDAPLFVFSDAEMRVLDDVRRRQAHDIYYPYLSPQDLQRLDFLKYYLAIRGRVPVSDEG